MLEVKDMTQKWHALITKENVDIVNKWRNQKHGWLVGSVIDVENNYYIDQDGIISLSHEYDSILLWDINLISFLESELGIEKTIIQDYNYLIIFLNKLNIK